MLISIITPLYNAEKYIQATIKSIQKQTYANWELLIVNDASTDNSLEIVSEIALSDSRIKLITLSQNKGAAVARNKGIKEANGDFIAFIDSDDIWHKDKLKEQLNFMLNNNFDFTFTNYYLIENEIQQPFQSLLSVVEYKDIIRFNYIACSTVMFNRKKLGKFYMPNIRNRQDWGLWIKLIEKAGKAVNLSKYLMYYNIRQDSISSNKIKMVKFHWYIYNSFLKFNTVKAGIYLLKNILLHIINKRK